MAERRICRGPAKQITAENNLDHVLREADSTDDRPLIDLAFGLDFRPEAAGNPAAPDGSAISRRNSPRPFTTMAPEWKCGTSTPSDEPRIDSIGSSGVVADLRKEVLSVPRRGLRFATDLAHAGFPAPTDRDCVITVLVGALEREHTSARLSRNRRSLGLTSTRLDRRLASRMAKTLVTRNLWISTTVGLPLAGYRSQVERPEVAHERESRMAGQ